MLQVCSRLLALGFVPWNPRALEKYISIPNQGVHSLPRRSSQPPPTSPPPDSQFHILCLFGSSHSDWGVPRRQTGGSSLMNSQHSLGEWTMFMSTKRKISPSL